MSSSSSSEGRTPLSDSNGQRSNIKLRPRPPPDPSVLRPSISVSVTGMKQAVQCLENGSGEIRNYLLNECNLIYECKSCFNMFRSLANFVSHKRSYCQSKIKDVKHIYDNHYDENDVERPSESYSTMAYVEPEAVDTIVPEPEWDVEDYSPSLALLKEAGFIEEIQSKPLVTKLKPDLGSIVKKLKSRAESDESDYYRKKFVESKFQDYPILRLEKINQTDRAMFQTYSFGENSCKTMGQKYVEWQKLRQLPSVMVGPDGKIIQPGRVSKNVNSLASNNDSTKENTESILRYPCPLCKSHYSKVVAVFRHLTNAHQKTVEQSHSYRKRIKKAAFYLDQSQAMDCVYCRKTFISLTGRLAHQKSCKSRSSFGDHNSLMHILNNQPVIVLHKLDHLIDSSSANKRRSDKFLQVEESESRPGTRRPSPTIPPLIKLKRKNSSANPINSALGT